MQKWEYKIADFLISDVRDEPTFNELGDEGWELVAVVHDTSGSILPNEKGYVQGDIITTHSYIFKRPKP